MDQSRASEVFDISASLSQPEPEDKLRAAGLPAEAKARELLQQFEYCADRKKFIEVKEGRTAKKVGQISSDELDEVAAGQQIIYVVGREKQVSGAKAIDSSMALGLAGLLFHLFWSLGLLLYFTNIRFDGRVALSGSCGSPDLFLFGFLVFLLFALYSRLGSQAVTRDN